MKTNSFVMVSLVVIVLTACASAIEVIPATPTEFQLLSNDKNVESE